MDTYACIHMYVCIVCMHICVEFIRQACRLGPRSLSHDRKTENPVIVQSMELDILTETIWYIKGKNVKFPHVLFSP